MAVALGSMWASGMLYLTQGLLRLAAPAPRVHVRHARDRCRRHGRHSRPRPRVPRGRRRALIGQLSAYTIGAATAFWLARELWVPRFDRAKLRAMLAYSCR